MVYMTALQHATGGDADRSLCPSLLLVVMTSYPA